MKSLSNEYDLVIVGGGIAGSTLARVMSGCGASTLVIEKEERFKDRVRGDGMTSWGAGLARDLGIYDLLLDQCGHELPMLDIFVNGAQIANRNLIETTPGKTPFFTFFHPAMQEALLSAAESAGATVARGVQACGVTLGASPSVAIRNDEGVTEVRARLVVGADGRTSAVRKWAGFPVKHDEEHLVIAGVLMEHIDTSVDTASLYFNPEAGKAAYFFPQRNKRVRAYAVHHVDQTTKLSGSRQVARFLQIVAEAGVPPETIREARAVGPLASFNGAAYWVPQPYRQGVTLIGDAAASSDPVWGEGLSLALQDVRILSERLSADPDWNRAAASYAQEHERRFAVNHDICNWYAEFFLRTGVEASLARARAFPKLAQDPTRVPDLFALGSDTPNDELARARFFGEV
ncbi:MAG: NAD(P)/FAD-dependent oxidoreductase [Burkholderiales bacterium]